MPALRPGAILPLVTFATFPLRQGELIHSHHDRLTRNGMRLGVGMTNNQSLHLPIPLSTRLEQDIHVTTPKNRCTGR